MRLWPSGGRDLFPSSARVLALLCTLVIPAVPYMLTGLAGYLVDPGISCGARKLVRTSWIKKKLINILVYLHGMKEQDRAISWNLPGKGTKLFINFAWFQAYHSKHVLLLTCIMFVVIIYSINKVFDFLFGETRKSIKISNPDKKRKTNKRDNVNRNYYYYIYIYIWIIKIIFKSATKTNKLRFYILTPCFFVSFL
jgi:hypothetical protein